MLPIQLPQFTPDQWRSLEKQLIAIANREKLELEPRDRKVNNILALAQHYARSKRWKEAFNILRYHGIVAIKYQATLLQLFTAQKMAYVLVGSPKNKTQKAVKVAKSKKAKINHNPLICFCIIRSFFPWIDALGKNTKPRKNREAKKIKGSSTLTKGKILAEVFDKILTDKWQDVKTLHEKFGEISPIPMERSRFDDRLEYRAKKGEIFKFKPDGSNCAFYSSNPDASSFENEWMDLNRAYAIACSNGYTAAINTFRCKADKADMTKEGILRYYRRFGLEYRFKSEIPEGENRFFKWRVIN